ncbi:hypothetical protein [Tenacibaculum ovolyticum]|uniref:hypothetical protein n=1 Tax=Tenacibaculum ovolyticum TaxID=104270 RepID=UPI0007EDCCAA|nr:hypothetical protein [Tenacibaculum ovolyticum]
MEKIIKTLFNSYALTGFFAVFGYWLFFKDKGKGKDQEDEYIQDIDTTGTTLNDVEAKVIANICETAFENSWSEGGTDEKTLNRVLLNLTNPSFNHVYKSYGIRFDKTLVQTLVDELDEDEIKPYVLRFKIVK